MSLLQTLYVQKSRLFLVPLTGIRYNPKFPIKNSYIESSDLVSREYPNGISRYDKILIITFPKEYFFDSLDSMWEKYESENLLSNKYFLSIHESPKNFVYTFDMEKWDHEWNCFVEGRYSYFGDKAKAIITSQFIKNPRSMSPEHNRLFCYLYPYLEDCVELFAKDFGYHPDTVRKNIKEFCSKPDFNRETFNLEINKIDLDENQSTEIIA